MYFESYRQPDPYEFALTADPERRLYAMDFATGAIQWKFEIEKSIGNARALDGVFYFTSPGHVSDRYVFAVRGPSQ